MSAEDKLQGLVTQVSQDSEDEAQRQNRKQRGSSRKQARNGDAIVPASQGGGNHDLAEKKAGARKFPFSFLGCFRGAGQKDVVEVLDPPNAQPEEERFVPQLPSQTGRNVGRKTLVLDLDETLVHSSFRPVANAHIVITVEIDGQYHHVFVLKRPGVDEFLERVSRIYEVVVYTASLSKYADPLLDKLDAPRSVSHRLFREACSKHPQGGYVKDLSKLGRNLKDVIIIDNSPNCYALQPDNAIPIKTWFDDPQDRELYDLVPILEALVLVDDIPAVLKRTLNLDEEEEEEEGGSVHSIPNSPQ